MKKGKTSKVLCMAVCTLSLEVLTIHNIEAVVSVAENQEYNRFL